MPAPLPLTSAQWPEVRAVIDISLDSSALPDATIALGSFQGAAEAEVKAALPNWASYTDANSAEYQRTQRAAIYLIAARISRSLPALTSETFGNYRYQLQVADPAERSALLEDQAAAEIAAVLDPAGDADLAFFPHTFTVAGSAQSPSDSRSRALL